MNETIPNKALSGAELKAIMIEKFEHMLANDSMLADHVAYGRIAYDITLRMHIDNPYYASPMASTISSSPVGRNLLDAAPELTALESGPPLKAPITDASVASGSRLSHQIDSPNAERLASGIPVPVETVQPNGQVRAETIKYPIQGTSNVKVEDITPETSRELGLGDRMKATLKKWQGEEKK